MTTEVVLTGVSDAVKVSAASVQQPVPWTVQKPVSIGVSGLMPMGMQCHNWSTDTVDQGSTRLGMSLARIGAWFWASGGFLNWDTDPGLQTMLHYADRCKALGITPLAVFTQQAGGGLAKVGMSTFPMWIQWIKDGVAQLRARGVRHYEILNEPGVGAGPPFTGTECGQLFVATADAIRSVQSDAICVGPATTATFRNGAWVTQMLAVPGVLQRMDMFSEHTYYLVPPEQSLLQDTLYVMGLVNGIAGRKMNFLQSECGYTDGTGVPSTAEQDNFGSISGNADRHSRRVFLHRGSGYAMSAFYKLRRDGADTVAGENNFGVQDWNWADRVPVSGVLRDAFAQTRASTGAANYQRGSNWFTRLDPGQKLAAWNPTQNANDSVWIVADAPGTLNIKTLGGGSAPVALTQGRQQVALSLGTRAKLLSSSVPIHFPEFT